MTPATAKLTFRYASEAEASRAAKILADTSMADDYVFAITEAGPDWMLEVYFPGNEAADHEQAIRSALSKGHAWGEQEWSREVLADVDWVALSQQGLAPVRAGRFIVHGSHDRQKLPRRLYNIEIDAGRAFGTAHHGSTLGCLQEMDRLASQRNVRGALDIGTGSGVLAIAAAQCWRCPVAALDIDPVAVAVARENCRKNGVNRFVSVWRGDASLRHELKQRALFDLVTANILAKPLLGMALNIRSLTAPCGVVILSGLLIHQAREIIAHYAANGFALLSSCSLDGWATLTLIRMR